MAVTDYPASAYVGQEVLLTARITASEPVTINLRWLHNGTPIAGSESSFDAGPAGGDVQFKFAMPEGEQWSNAQFTLELNYDGKVSFDASSVTAASCNVQTLYTEEQKQARLPEINVAIIDYPASAYVGQEVLLTAHITSSEPVTINLRWLRGGKPIPYWEDPAFSASPSGGVTQLRFTMPQNKQWGYEELSLELNYTGKTALRATSVTKASCKIQTLYTAEQLSDVSYVQSLVQNPIFNARAVANTTIYASPNAGSKVLGTAKAGALCYYRYEKISPYWAFVTCGNISGWVKFSDLSVGYANNCTKPDLEPVQKETYINSLGLSSKTDYLIWVNLERTRVNVFLRENNAWKLCTSFLCTIGANETPTIMGEFECQYREKWWKYDGYYVGPVLRFYNGYAFHSTLLRYDGGFYDGRLGKTLSHGCVRLAHEDIGWMISYIPMKTKVYIK